MKTLEEKAAEYCKNEICPTCSDNERCIKTNRIGDCIPTYMEYAAFIAGYRAAFEWISVEDELPENETYINIKLKNGDLGARFYESIDKDMLLNTSTHWRPIND